ncbi:MAG: homocysteine S-methyltransferase family protein [Candidatus Eisenbacteria sp.]|nr:homocysteine S-methyltransferase family protein [Candidatus Eisenbacteria bacterium]
MKAIDLEELLTRRVLLLDGATGTALMSRGMPAGTCPEMWVLQNPHVIQEIQRGYFEAGSDAIYSCTFGANRLRLRAVGAPDEDVSGLNERLVRISREVAPPGRLVAGDIGPIGQLIEPSGDLDFEDALSIFKEQVAGLIAGGVDFLVLETMMDIQEARAALIAVKDLCDLPVLASMTYEEGRTLTGTPPEAAAVILQSLGAFAVGCNCSTGPEQMLDTVERTRKVARVPILAKPNSGLPVVRNGKTVFPMGPDAFATATARLAEAGAAILGGCCGTTEKHIRELSNRLKQVVPPRPRESGPLCLASPRRVVTAGTEGPVRIIGERINPTGRKKLQAALQAGRYEEIRKCAMDQAKAGAHILDVNVGMPGIDEDATMRAVVKMLSVAVDLPLCLDSSSPETLASALRIYPGRALVNSISAERAKLERALPIAARYGAALLILPVSDKEIPETAAMRCGLIERVFSRASGYGYTKSDIVVDGLVMTISSQTRAARETLKTVAWARDVFGANTVIGLSNVSFGLPERHWLNATFLAMAISHGLTMVIANPEDPMIQAVKPAADALTGRDPSCLRYIERLSARKTSKRTISGADMAATAKAHATTTATADGAATAEATPSARAFDAVVHGDRETIADLINEALEAGSRPLDLVNECLIPGLMEVGERFERKEYFLPQLMLSAETTECAFAVLRPLLEKETTQKLGKVVLATVEGDIHDIGKNIVALMLRNHGFEVIDLGKSVSADEIIEKARQERAHVIGLSALMTTTMTKMASVIDRIKASGLPIRVMIGGAVITESYARDVGADGYASDAVEAVKIAKELMNSEANT